MFIQIMQGRCTRHDEMRDLADAWVRDLSPGAIGWLGGTFGFTDDDHFVGVVRFESAQAARENSERPEQGAWAERFMDLMDGPVEFHDCDDVTLMMDGGSDSAGFVQVIRGRVNEPERLKALMADTETLHDARPDILGATLAFEPDGTFTETVAFTSEEAARAGESNERMEMPAGMRETLDTALHGATFYDLHQPWFASRWG